ncbi:MAG: T9SS type A sorting domain-containing protein [Bacteroidia bacterium]
MSYFLTDSTNQDAQVEFWLNRALDLRSKYRLAWHHARKNQYSTALAVTNGLSTQFTLNQPQLAEKARFESLIAFKQSLGTTGLAGVNGEGISWLENFVASTDDAFDYSLALAQNALQHQGSTQIHQVHLPQSEPQGRRAANKEQALQQLREDLTVLKLYPNPANAFATLAFELPQDVEEATLVIADLTGKIVNRILLDGKKGQQLIDTRNLPAGMYITSVVCKTGILKRDKLVISR